MPWPPGGGGERSGGEQIGAIVGNACALLAAHRGGELVRGEHIEFSGDAEDQSLLEHFWRKCVRVAVDQAGQERAVGAVDDLGVGRRLEIGGEGFDPSIFRKNIQRTARGLAVEDADVAEKCRRGLGLRIRRRL